MVWCRPPVGVVIQIPRTRFLIWPSLPNVLLCLPDLIFLPALCICDEIILRNRHGSIERININHRPTIFQALKERKEMEKRESENVLQGIVETALDYKVRRVPHLIQTLTLGYIPRTLSFGLGRLYYFLQRNWKYRLQQVFVVLSSSSSTSPRLSSPFSSDHVDDLNRILHTTLYISCVLYLIRSERRGAWQGSRTGIASTTRPSCTERRRSMPSWPRRRRERGCHRSSSSSSSRAPSSSSRQRRRRALGRRAHGRRRGVGTVPIGVVYPHPDGPVRQLPCGLRRPVPHNERQGGRGRGGGAGWCLRKYPPLVSVVALHVWKT